MPPLKRARLCSFIQRNSERANIGQEAMDAAMLYFHVFYARHSEEDYKDSFLVALACMFLAAKANERTRELKNVNETNLQRSGSLALTNGILPHIISSYLKLIRDKKVKPSSAGDTSEAIITAVHTMEVSLLDALEFNMEMPLPHRLVAKMTFQVFDAFNFIHTNKKTPEKTKELTAAHLAEKGGLLSVAWSFVTDSMKTTLYLSQRAETIVVTCVFLAFKFRDIHLVRRSTSSSSSPTSPSSSATSSAEVPWHQELFGVEKKQMQGMFSEILRVCYYNKKQPVPAAVRVSTNTSTNGSRSPNALELDEH